MAEKKQVAPPAGEGSWDEWLAGLLGENREGVGALVSQMLNADRLVWAFCGKCRSKVKVDYPDFRGATKMLELLLDRTEGRPGQKRGGSELAGLSREELRVRLRDPVERGRLLARALAIVEEDAGG